MRQSKIILFGGSFDPIHRGHFEVAQAALAKLGGEMLIFIPAKRSPLKETFPKADAADRLAMIRLAIEGKPAFDVSDCELRRPDPSYTWDTVREFRRQRPDAILYWLVGADVVSELPHWYRIHDLLENCCFAVMHRAGYALPDFDKLRGIFRPEQIESLQKNIVAVPLIDISSTEVRRRLARGEDAGNLLPGPVYNYIREKKLYQNR